MERLDQAPDQLRDIANDVEHEYPMSASILRLIADDVFKAQYRKQRRADVAAVEEVARPLLTVPGLLARGRELWGEQRMNGHEIVACLAVIVGDLARVVRDEHESGMGDGAKPVQRRELGNLIVSAVRWADDLGLDPRLCVTDALDAQCRYVEKRREHASALSDPDRTETHD